MVSSFKRQQQSDSQDSTAERVPFEKRWHSHSTAICTGWVAQRTRKTTHSCRTDRCDAVVPMHKVSQHMQKTIAQHITASTKKRKSHLGTFSSSARAFRAKFHGKAATPKTVAREPTFLRKRTFVYPRKHIVFPANPNVQIAPMM